MNKRILSLSIAAIIGGVGVAGGASAAVLSPSGGTAASALNQSTDGTGHILLVPYFTTQAGNATLLNIVNTDQKNGKAVKVRFRGASNSDDVFDFQIYMSPGDVWTANVSQGSDGRSVLTTNDKTCTRPAVVTGTSFPTGRLPSTYTAAQLANETREGYIEILNMADVPKGATADQVAAPGNAALAVNPLFAAIKHSSGVPTCAETALGLLSTDPTGFSKTQPYYQGTVSGVVVDNGSGFGALTNTAETTSLATSAQTLGLTYPSGGLFANWTIINVPNTTTYSGTATAVKATGNNGLGNLVFFPQTDNPLTTTYVSAAAAGAATVAVAGTVDQITADPLLRTSAVGDYTGLKQVPFTPLVTAAYYDQPDLSTPYVGVVNTTTTSALTQALLLTGSLAVSSVSNEYLTNPLINAATDWVFSSPTRRYNTAFNYAYSSSTGDGRVFTNYASLGATQFHNTAGGTTTTVANTDYPFFSPLNTSVSGKQICVTSDTQNGFGQEEQATTTGFVVSPGTPYVLSFCGETSIVVFGSSSVLGAAVASNKAPPLPATDGWLRIGTTGKAAVVTGGFNSASPSLTAASTSYGLPVIGYSAEKAVNGAVSAGVSGNFGLLFGHRANK